MCIYYKNKDGLHYTSEEHVFPACLGGISKLAFGVVSDEANSYFSKLETHLARQSMVSLERNVKGPGKRGSSKIGEQTIGVIWDGQGKAELGYVFNGKISLIFSIVIYEAEITSPKKIPIVVNMPPENASKKVLIAHYDKMISLIKNNKDENNKLKYVHVEQIKNCCETIVGYYRNKIYIASPKKGINVDNLFNILQKLEKEVALVDVPSKSTHINAEIEGHVEETLNDARVYGKIAFNVLAKLFGANYVEASKFDAFRQWLMGMENPEYERYFWPNEKDYISDGMFPTDAHYCLISTCALPDDTARLGLAACVRLYNIKRTFLLGRITNTTNIMLNGYICDWKNKKEYLLMDYLHQRAKEKEEQAKHELFGNY